VTFITVIIPTLNEEDILPKTLQSLQVVRQKGVELIVVDGGSEDATVSIAKQFADKVLSAEPGRAKQLNKGAEYAHGKLLVFLHADTCLPSGAYKTLVQYAVQDECWGRFKVALNRAGRAYRMIEMMMNSRSCLTSIVTGDHTMFVSKKLFEKVAGYPDIALMEDIAISKKLKKHQALICLKETVITSARRWQENGVVSTILLMWRLRFLYFLNRSPQKLALAYRDARLK